MKNLKLLVWLTQLGLSVAVPPAMFILLSLSHTLNTFYNILGFLKSPFWNFFLLTNGNVYILFLHVRSISGILYW